ncbi:MAG: hypothetical protein ABSB88_25470 [Bryobacteraceae bacterium]|jgi:hypothetical protein
MTRIGNKSAMGLGMAIVLAAAAASAYDLYASARQKFDLISSDRLLAGARIELSPAELNAYAQHEVPPGVRNPKLQLVARGEATGTAMVDFGKVRRARGDQPGWLMSKLLDGERPVSVTVRIHSSGGTAKVDVLRVDVSGVEIDGKVLDFLIQNVLLPLYPNAMVGRTFGLSHRIDRLEVGPAGVSVVIGR